MNAFGDSREIEAERLGLGLLLTLAAATGLAVAESITTSRCLA